MVTKGGYRCGDGAGGSRCGCAAARMLIQRAWSRCDMYGISASISSRRRLFVSATATAEGSASYAFASAEAEGFGAFGGSAILQYAVVDV